MTQGLWPHSAYSIFGLFDFFFQPEQCFQPVSAKILPAERGHTGSGNVPYVQFESVDDFIPEPRCSKFAVGLQTRRRKMEGTGGPVGLWLEGPRATGAPLSAKCSSVYSWFEPGGSTVVY